MSADLRLDLVVPVLRLGAFDPVEHFLGARIADLVEPLLAGPIAARRLRSGALVEVYPLRLPDGEGLGLPLGAWGEAGLANVDGRLVLTVPRAAARLVATALGRAVLGSTPCAGGFELVVELRPGLRAAWPLGSLGEIAFETPGDRG